MRGEAVRDDSKRYGDRSCWRHRHCRSSPPPLPLLGVVKNENSNVSCTSIPSPTPNPTLLNLLSSFKQSLFHLSFPSCHIFSSYPHLIQFLTITYFPRLPAPFVFASVLSQPIEICRLKPVDVVELILFFVLSFQCSLVLSSSHVHRNVITRNAVIIVLLCCFKADIFVWLGTLWP